MHGTGKSLCSSNVFIEDFPISFIYKKEGRKVGRKEGRRKGRKKERKKLRE